MKKGFYIYDNTNIKTVDFNRFEKVEKLKQKKLFKERRSVFRKYNNFIQ